MKSYRKAKKLIEKGYILFSLLIFIFIFISMQLSAQGLLLRCEKWQKFYTEGKTADFYVSPDGNDS